MCSHSRLRARPWWRLLTLALLALVWRVGEAAHLGPSHLDEDVWDFDAAVGEQGSHSCLDDWIAESGSEPPDPVDSSSDDGLDDEVAPVAGSYGKLLMSRVERRSLGKDGHDFVPSRTFVGPRCGYVFTTSVKGTGYHLDCTAPCMEVDSPPAAWPE